MKKNDLGVLKKDIQHLICPICKTKFNNHIQFITCLNNHTFDIAKEGYINLALKKSKSIYGRELFDARKKVIQQSFFDSLEEIIVKMVHDRYLQNEQLVILDAGCGEGSLFSRILLSLKREGLNYIAVGIDNAKEGIKLATKEDYSILWVVGDISNIPMADSSVDIILNTLSPANYSEFKRLLKDHGIVIKTIPNGDYLKEFRQNINKTDYSNQRISKLFSNNLENIEKNNIRYVKYLNQEQRKLVWEMTPLTQNNDMTESALNTIKKVTVDFVILLGHKKTTTR